MVSGEFERECVVVLDEAHNIDNVCIEALSGEGRGNKGGGWVCACRWRRSHRSRLLPRLPPRSSRPVGAATPLVDAPTSLTLPPAVLPPCLLHTLPPTIPVQAIRLAHDKALRATAGQVRPGGCSDQCAPRMSHVPPAALAVAAAAPPSTPPAPPRPRVQEKAALVDLGLAQAEDLKGLGQRVAALLLVFLGRDAQAVGRAMGRMRVFCGGLRLA